MNLFIRLCLFGALLGTGRAVEMLEQPPADRQLTVSEVSASPQAPSRRLFSLFSNDSTTKKIFKVKAEIQNLDDQMEQNSSELTRGSTRD